MLRRNARVQVGRILKVCHIKCSGIFIFQLMCTMRSVHAHSPAATCSGQHCLCPLLPPSERSVAETQGLRMHLYERIPLLPRHSSLVMLLLLTVAVISIIMVIRFHLTTHSAAPHPPPPTFDRLRDVQPVTTCTFPSQNHCLLCSLFSL
jgi:hypothetical protein